MQPVTQVDARIPRDLIIRFGPRRPSWVRYFTGRKGARSVQVVMQSDKATDFIDVSYLASGRLGLQSTRIKPDPLHGDYNSFVDLSPTADLLIAKLALGRSLLLPPYTVRGLWRFLRKAEAPANAPWWQRWLRWMWRKFKRTIWTIFNSLPTEGTPRAGS